MSFQNNKGRGLPQAKSTTLQSFGLLCFRLAVGAAFVLHGLQKTPDAMTWLGTESGIPPLMQAAAAYAELVGGAALMLGFLTPIASLFIMGTMIGAMVIVHIPAGHPFVSMGSSYELAMIYLMAAVMFFMVGPGYYSVDGLLMRDMNLDAEDRSVALGG